MVKKTIYLRGHHLRLLYGYANLKGNEYRTKVKDEIVLITAVMEGHSKKHGYNITKILKDALQPKAKVRLTDTLDDICETCNHKNKKVCKEFIPYDVSAASDDRATIHYYGLKKRNYTSEYLVKRLLEKGRF